MMIYDTLALSQCNTPSQQSPERCGRQSCSSISTRTHPHTATAGTRHTDASRFAPRDIIFDALETHAELL